MIFFTNVGLHTCYMSLLMTFVRLCYIRSLLYDIWYNNYVVNNDTKST